MYRESLENSETEPSMRRLHEVCQRISELPNISSSVGVLLKRKSEIGELEYLVVYNADKNSFGNPAGHLNEGETLLEAVEREVQEETNISAQQYQLTGIFLALLASCTEKSSLLVVYEGQITDDIPKEQEIIDEDVTFVRFMTPEEIRKETVEYERHEGSTILRVETDMHKQSPEDLLENLKRYFDECGIDESVLF